jgi:hypothetical protein
LGLIVRGREGCGQAWFGGGSRGGAKEESPGGRGLVFLAYHPILHITALASKGGWRGGQLSRVVKGGRRRKTKCCLVVGAERG